MKHMVNASSCTAELWIHSGDALGRLLIHKNSRYSLLTSPACLQHGFVGPYHRQTTLVENVMSQCCFTDLNVNVLMLVQIQAKC